MTRLLLKAIDIGASAVFVGSAPKHSTLTSTVTLYDSYNDPRTDQGSSAKVT